MRAGNYDMDAFPDLRTLAQALGGEVSNGQVLAPGPGHSAKDRSLSIKLDSNAPGGFLVHSFSTDDPIACRDYVREKVGLPAFKPNGRGRHQRISESTVERAVMAAAAGQAQTDKPKGRIVATYRRSVERKPDRGDAKRSEVALAIWQSASAAQGTPVETYLASRGLHLPPVPTLRFHAGLKHPSGGIWPGMVALVMNGAGGTPVAIHRTFLARDGGGKRRSTRMNDDLSGAISSTSTIARTQPPIGTRGVSLSRTIFVPLYRVDCCLQLLPRCPRLSAALVR